MIPRYPFRIGALLSPSLYLQPFPRYLALSILGSRPLPFRVTRRHRSRDYSIPRWPFPIGTKSLSQAIFQIMGIKHIGGRDLDLSGSRDVIGHVTIVLGMGHFLLVVLLTQVSISNGFRDIPPQTSCSHRHNAKSSLRMRVSRDMYPLCKF